MSNSATPETIKTPKVFTVISIRQDKLNPEVLSALETLRLSADQFHGSTMISAEIMSSVFNLVRLPDVSSTVTEDNPSISTSACS